MFIVHSKIPYHLSLIPVHESAQYRYLTQKYTVTCALIKHHFIVIQTITLFFIQFCTHL